MSASITQHWLARRIIAPMISAVITVWFVRSLPDETPGSGGILIEVVMDPLGEFLTELLIFGLIFLATSLTLEGIVVLIATAALSATGMWIAAASPTALVFYSLICAGLWGSTTSLYTKTVIFIHEPLDFDEDFGEDPGINKGCAVLLVLPFFLLMLAAAVTISFIIFAHPLRLSWPVSAGATVAVGLVFLIFFAAYYRRRS